MGIIYCVPSLQRSFKLIGLIGSKKNGELLPLRKYPIFRIICFDFKVFILFQNSLQ